VHRRLCVPPKEQDIALPPNIGLFIERSSDLTRIASFENGIQTATHLEVVSPPILLITSPTPIKQKENEHRVVDWIDKNTYCDTDWRISTGVHSR
jgi:hypothetical protein